jgi:hypothetical protein
MLAQDMRSDLERGLLSEEDGESDEAGEEDETFLHLLYDEIEQALAAAMGPVAVLVMNDALERWREDGPAIPGRVSELITTLAMEIGNTELADEFRQRVQKLL